MLPESRAFFGNKLKYIRAAFAPTLEHSSSQNGVLMELQQHFHPAGLLLFNITSAPVSSMHTLPSKNRRTSVKHHHSADHQSNHSTNPELINPHRLFHGIWLPQWLKERPEVSPRAKLLYAELCRFAGKHGEAWPSYNLLAKNLCVSRRHVMRLLHELISFELVMIHHVRNSVRGNCTNIYRFLWHPWMQLKEDKSSTLKCPENQPPFDDYAIPPHSMEISYPSDMGVINPSDNVAPLVTRTASPW